MTEDQIKHMVSRFLMWKLPEHFRPDAGISFKAEFNENTAYPMKHEPVGTNLFDAVQAEAMVRHMVGGLPPAGTVTKEMTNAAFNKGKELGMTGGPRDFAAVVEASLALVQPSATASAEYRSCINLARYFLSNKSFRDSDSEDELAQVIQCAIDGWFSEQDNKAEAAWEHRQSSLKASGGPDDSSYRRDMINAGRGHLLR